MQGHFLGSIACIRGAAKVTREEQLTPAELARRAELFWINA